MKRCTKVKSTPAPTIKPTWYARLTPTRKTVEKWLKRLVKAFKVEISFGETFKWIFFILVWNTFFPNSINTFVSALKLAAPFM